jgi:Na+-driven multidrug efflux pump
VGAQVYGYIWKFFKDEQKAAAGGKAGQTIDVWGSVVKMADWKIFSKHSFYLLLSGYFGVADQQINTILISRMGSVDLAGNSLIGTMMSYPYIFAGAFGTVISTLGSKYIGARDDRAYLKLGLVMIVLSTALGVSLGFVVIFFAGALSR